MRKAKEDETVKTEELERIIITDGV